jgi:hypothetical protein
MILELWKESVSLKARIAELEAQVTKNSNNSSKPPSSDPPWVKHPPEKEKSGRGSRAASPDTRGISGSWSPPERVNKSKDHYPDQCGKCAKDLDPAMDK